MMTDTPRVPLSPSELPQQRLYEVIDLPKRPEPMDVVVAYTDLPSGAVEGRKPRNVNYLCQVEWVWSPIHERLDAYYVHRGKSHWNLWVSQLHDAEVPWRWSWHPVACVPLKQATEREAAIYLLLEYWRVEQDQADLDKYHWINGDGLLSVAEVNAIATEVW